MISVLKRVALTACLCLPAGADEADPVTRPLLLKIYPLGELATGVLAAEDDSSHIIRTYPATRGFRSDLLGVGQGFGDGGGAFSVSDDLASRAQTAPDAATSDDDTGDGRHSKPALSLVIGGPVTINPRDYQGIVESLSAPAEIQSLVITYVAPESWESNGGVATIRAVNHALLIRQTVDNHQKVGAFLRQLHASLTGQRTMTLRLWWIPLADNHALKAALRRGDTAGPQLDQLCAEHSGYQSSVQMRTGVPAIIDSGAQKLVVTGRVPVAGTDSPGYRPITELTPVGLSAIVSGRELTEWEGQGVRLDVETALTSLTSCQADANERLIDRCDIDRLSLKTTCVCQPGRPIIAGQLTRLKSKTAKSDKVDMCLVLLLDAAAPSAP